MKAAAESKTESKKLDPHATCVVNSCREKNTGVLF